MRKTMVALVLALSMILCSFPAAGSFVDSSEAPLDGSSSETSAVEADGAASAPEAEPEAAEDAGEAPEADVEAEPTEDASAPEDAAEASPQEAPPAEEDAEAGQEEAEAGDPAEAEPVEEDAEAEQAAEVPHVSHKGEPGTLLGLMAADEEEAPYEAHTALVMLRTGNKLTRKKAKESLRQMEAGIQDLEVQEVYSFDQRQTAVIGGGTQACSSVCLVRSRTASTEQIIRTLNKRDDVLYAEPNYRVHMCSVDDSYFPCQWSMQGGSAGTSAYQENTPNVSAVWDRGTTGSEAIVAIVDTGVNYKHPDLANNMWHNTHQPELAGKYGYDFVGGDNNPMDENGHGSHCAGIIGAQGNNGIGISGVNQSARIMALRTLDAGGSSWLSHEVAAYHYINKALDLGEPIRAINNSWGGGENSQIFAELIDIVGEKGAISCFAAGNSANDNDANPDYPSSIMSPYKLTVAATTEAGELASFSNYGRESVDVAAPGTDILSTVCCDCYNPSIYGGNQDRVSAQFNDYESGAPEEWGSVKQLKDNLYLNGEPYVSGSGKPEISISAVQDGFLNSEEQAAGIEVKNLKARDIVCIALPYELDEDAVTAPHCSLMVKAAATTDGTTVLGVLDVPQGTPLDVDTIDDLYLGDGRTLDRMGFDRWSHFSFHTMTDEELDAAFAEAAAAEEAGVTLARNPLKREIVLVLYATEHCDAKIHLDDFGLSRQDLEGTDQFGQYDFYNGTSMATPFITGSAALLASEAEQSGEPLDPGVLVGKIFSLSKEGSLPVAAGGSFDFTKLSSHLRPWIGKILADKSGGSITIRGMGLNGDGMTVQLGRYDEEELHTAEILSQSDKELVVKDNRWVNNLVNLRITDADGHSTARSFHYLVSGKQEYTPVEGVRDETLSGALATDGRYIYSVDKYNNGAVLKLDTRDLKKGAAPLGTIDPSTLFTLEKDKKARYAMALGDDLAYLNGKLYTVVEYGKAEETEPDPDAGEDYWYDEEGRLKRYRIYAGESQLVRMDTQSGEVECLGALPAELNKTTDYTLAAYNGKLLFIGGYSYESDALTDRVKVYDPAEKRWSDGTPLPEARARGKALQSGNRLIYTMGWSAADDLENYRCPANLILDGEQWTRSSLASEDNLSPFFYSDLVTRGEETYPLLEACVSAVKNGLIYTGMPSEDYGDTYVYQASGDAYEDTGYQYFTGYEILRGIAVGGTLYGFDGVSVYTAAAAESALVPIGVEAGEGGTVSGAAELMPGNDAVFEVRADKGYVIQSITVDSRNIPLEENAETKTVTIDTVVEAHSVKALFERKRLSVTVESGPGGTVSGPAEVLYGDDAVFDIAAEQGYVIQSITVDGQSVALEQNTEQKTVTIDHVEEAHTVRVLFEKKRLSVQVKKNKGGTVSGPTEVFYGDNAVFEAKAKKGYVIKAITVDSKRISVKKNATKKTIKLKNVVGNHVVKVSFKKRVFSIKVKKNKGGTVTGQTKPQWGSKATLKIKAKKRYVIRSITIDSKRKAVKRNTRKKTVVFKNVKKNHSIKVVFRRR